MHEIDIASAQRSDRVPQGAPGSYARDDRARRVVPIQYRSLAGPSSQLPYLHLVPAAREMTRQRVDRDWNSGFRVCPSRDDLSDVHLVPGLELVPRGQRITPSRLGDGKPGCFEVAESDHRSVRGVHHMDAIRPGSPQRSQRKKLVIRRANQAFHTVVPDGAPDAHQHLPASIHVYQTGIAVVINGGGIQLSIRALCQPHIAPTPAQLQLAVVSYRTGLRIDLDDAIRRLSESLASEAEHLPV